MQDVVIIPTFDRPEMLWLCLDYIAASPESADVRILVYADAHVQQVTPRKDIEEVLGKFPQLAIDCKFRPEHGYSGNSYNVLMAYKDAYHTQAQHVFLIEDDVLVEPEFFAWHREQHRQKIECSIAVKNPGHGAYASLGVCFKREALQMILPHCRPAYFQNMRGYCKATFQPSMFDCEQDGLLARLLRGKTVAWATIPLAQHVGWYGYHRRKSLRPAGSLEARYEQVKLILTNTLILSQYVKEFGDILPIKIPCN